MAMQRSHNRLVTDAGLIILFLHKIKGLEKGKEGR